MIVGCGVDVFLSGSATVSAGARVDEGCAFEPALISIHPEQDTSTDASKRILNIRRVFLYNIESILSIPINYNKAGGLPCDLNLSELPLKSLLSL